LVAAPATVLRRLERVCALAAALSLGSAIELAQSVGSLRRLAARRAQSYAVTRSGKLHVVPDLDAIVGYEPLGQGDLKFPGDFAHRR
jgi:uncharacterized NAD(P)/FAD-binding protein YdhS